MIEFMILEDCSGFFCGERSKRIRMVEERNYIG